VTVDSAGVEAKAQRVLTEHFRAQSYQWPDTAAADSMSITAASERLQWVAEHLPGRNLAVCGQILVSGIGAGSEAVAARTLGALRVYGTEVDPVLLEVSRMRLAMQDGVHCELYDGVSLPWLDHKFGLVISGHVIEHTSDPQAYLCEHIRVLRPNGWLFLEFPSRYHYRELHTRLPSLEWMPRKLRNAGLWALSRRWTPLSSSVKHRCRSILETGLQQVSVRSVRAWLKNTAAPVELCAISHPSPGVVRSLWTRRS